MKNYGKLTGWLIAGWFVFAFVASALHLFRNDSERIGAAVGIAASVPLLVFLVWFAASKNFREFTLSLDPRVLTLSQAWRIIGFVFVLQEARHVLPGNLRIAAGYGDMLIGATATLRSLEASRYESPQQFSFSGKCWESWTWSQR